jgi:hypothetical protein
MVLVMMDLGGLGRVSHAVLSGPEVPDDLPFQESKDRTDDR